MLALLLELVEGVLVGLHVEQVGAVYGVAFDLVDDDLAAEVPVPEVQGGLRDGIGLYFLVLELLPVVIDNLVDLLPEPGEMGSALVQPLLLGVVLELENGLGDEPVHVGLLDDLRPLAVALDVHLHGQEQEVLVEVQLVLHLLDLGEYLVDEQPQPGQVFPALGLLVLDGQEVVLLEDEARVGGG